MIYTLLLLKISFLLFFLFSLLSNICISNIPIIGIEIIIFNIDFYPSYLFVNLSDDLYNIIIKFITYIITGLNTIIIAFHLFLLPPISYYLLLMLIVENIILNK